MKGGAIAWVGCVLGLSIGVSPACSVESIFTCDADEDCVAEAGAEALCEANNYCSVPEVACSTGRKWYRRSGDMGGDCVLDESAGTAGDDGGASESSGASSGAVAESGASSDSDPMPSDESSDGSVPGSSEGAGSTSGAPASSCDEQYGGAEGYMFCSETRTSCTFVAVGNMSISCSDICGMFGGTCVSANFNDVDPCTISEPGATCEGIDFNDALCECTKA
jgi:hypothetical protein